MNVQGGFGDKALVALFTCVLARLNQFHAVMINHFVMQRYGFFGLVLLAAIFGCALEKCPTMHYASANPKRLAVCTLQLE